MKKKKLFFLVIVWLSLQTNIVVGETFQFEWSFFIFTSFIPSSKSDLHP